MNEVLVAVFGIKPGSNILLAAVLSLLLLSFPIKRGSLVSVCVSASLFFGSFFPSP